jgi:hypothetical protein
MLEGDGSRAVVKEMLNQKGEHDRKLNALRRRISSQILFSVGNLILGSSFVFFEERDADDMSVVI